MHQTNGNSIIYSNQRGKIHFSNGLCFTAVSRFWIKNRENALENISIFSKMKQNHNRWFILQEFHVLLMEMMQKIQRKEIIRPKSKSKKSRFVPEIVPWLYTTSYALMMMKNQNGHNSSNFYARTSRFCMVVSIFI